MGLLTIDFAAIGFLGSKKAWMLNEHATVLGPVTLDGDLQVLGYDPGTVWVFLLVFVCFFFGLNHFSSRVESLRPKNSSVVAGVSRLHLINKAVPVKNSPQRSCSLVSKEQGLG